MDGSGFIIKVLALSAVLAALVKYGGEFLPLAPTRLTAAIAVSVPALAMGVVLWERQKRLNNTTKKFKE